MSIQAKALLLPSSTHASSLSTCFVVRPRLLDGVFYKRKLRATLWKEVNTYRSIIQTASNCPEEQAVNTAQLDFILTFPIAYFDHSQRSWSQVVSVLQFIIGVGFFLTHHRNHIVQFHFLLNTLIYVRRERNYTVVHTDICLFNYATTSL